MERRRAPRRHWVVGRNDQGQAMLEWHVDRRDVERLEGDPLAQTYDFLQKLEVPDLTLEDSQPPARRAEGCNPYDTGVFRTPIDRKQR